MTPPILRLLSSQTHQHQPGSGSVHTECYQFSDSYLLESPMRPMHFDCCNPSVSLCNGSILAFWCVAGLMWDLLSSQTYPQHHMKNSGRGTIHGTTPAAAVSWPAVSSFVPHISSRAICLISHPNRPQSPSKQQGILFRLCFCHIPSFIVKFRQGNDPQYYFSSSSELSSRV